MPRMRYKVRPGHKVMPDYTLWTFRGDAWGEAVGNILHRQPIRSFTIPMRVHAVINLWGPNGRLKHSRFNVNVPPGSVQPKPGRLRVSRQVARRWRSGRAR